MDTENALQTTSTELSTESAERADSPPEVVRWVAPTTDLYETPEESRLVCDIPGVSADRVEIQLEGDRLVVQANRGTGMGYRRTFALDSRTDRDGIRATVENGVLSLVLPRLAEHQPRRIPVS